MMACLLGSLASQLLSCFSSTYAGGDGYVDGHHADNNGSEDGEGTNRGSCLISICYEDDGGDHDNSRK